MIESLSELPANLRERVERELGADETIMWMAQPESRIALWRLLIVLPIALLFLGFMDFITIWAAISMGNSFSGWAIGFLAVWIFLGIVFVACVPWMSKIWARKSVYVITDHRVLTLDWRVVTVVRRYQPEQLRQAYISHQHEDVGTVVLMTETAWWRLVLGQTELETTRSLMNVRRPELALAMVRALSGVEEATGS